MRIIQIIFILLFFGLISCKKDSPIKEVWDDSNNSSVISLRSINIDSGAFEFSISPPIYVLEDVKNKFLESSYMQSHIDSFLMEFGQLRFNAATLDIGTNTDYLVTIPTIKEDKLTGFVFYLGHNNHYHFNIVRIADALSDLEKNDLNSVNPLLALSANRVNSYYYIYESKLDTALNTKIESYLSAQGLFVQKHEIESRDITISKRWHVWSGIEGDDLTYRYSDEISTVIACNTISYISFGSEGNLNGTSGGGYPTNPFPGSGFPGGDENEEPDLINVNKIQPDDLNSECAKYTFNQDALEYIQQLANSHFPCDSRSNLEILKDIANELCQDHTPLDNILGGEGSGSLGNHIVTLEEMKNALDGVETVTSNLIDCDGWSCVLDNMMNGNISNGFVCEIFSTFADSKYNLEFEVKDFSADPDFNNSARAGTVGNVGGGSTIYINSDFCSEGADDIPRIFSTILHEMIHAKFNNLLYQAGWDGDPNTKLQAWHQYVIQNYSDRPSGTQHGIMLNNFVDDMVNALIYANGGNGTKDDFLGLILNGFPPITYAYYPTEDGSLLTRNKVESMLEDFYLFIKSPHNTFFDPNNFNACD